MRNGEWEGLGRERGRQGKDRFIPDLPDATVTVAHGGQTGLKVFKEGKFPLLKNFKRGLRKRRKTEKGGKEE